MSHRVTKITIVVAAIATMGLVALSASAAPPAQGDPQRGAYILSLGGGCLCHTAEAGFLAGGLEFAGPFGAVYAKNITPDSETGIGDWTDQEISDAIRLGKRPDGTQLFPIHLYYTFSGIADQDVQDLVAFLRTVEPVKNAVPERELTVPVAPFEPWAAAPAVAPTEGLERGQYLVNTISHCGACHTPQMPDGSPDMSKLQAGWFYPGVGLVPNITPDEETGIGTWTEEQIATYLRTGVEPDGSEAGGLMALSVQVGYKDMTEADALAIAAYLKTIPAVKNVPQAPPELPVTGGATSSGPMVVGLLALLGGVAVLAGFVLRRWRYRRV
ncbi:MAG: c-type cytochrome [Anaerolineae bacterium]